MPNIASEMNLLIKKPLSRPECPSCGGRMLLACVEFEPGRDLRHYKCRACDTGVAVELRLIEN